VLHLIALPQQDPRLDSAIKLISDEDDIVLLDCGTDHASSPETLAPLASLIGADVHILSAIKPLPCSNATSLTYIDAMGLLQLTEKHAASLSWYPDV
jgi:sulfur transfer complex TusBCD TusB component (DsrH family)